MEKVIYVAGALKCNRVRKVAAALRNAGYEAFDDWHSAGPHADEEWQKHEIERGRPYSEAIKGHHAQLCIQFDKFHIERADAFVVMAPVGASGGIELGYAAGLGKPSFALFDGEPQRYDLMYGLGTGVCFSVNELIASLDWYIRPESQYCARNGRTEL